MMQFLNEHTFGALLPGYNVQMHLHGTWVTLCSFVDELDAEKQIESYKKDDVRDGDHFKYRIVCKDLTYSDQKESLEKQGWLAYESRAGKTYFRANGVSGLTIAVDQITGVATPLVGAPKEFTEKHMPRLLA